MRDDGEADVQIRTGDGELAGIATITSFGDDDVVDRALGALRDEFGDDLVRP